MDREEQALIRSLKSDLAFPNNWDSDLDANYNLTIERDGETWLIEVKAYRLTE